MTAQTKGRSKINKAVRTGNIRGGWSPESGDADSDRIKKTKETAIQRGEHDEFLSISHGHAALGKAKRPLNGLPQSDAWRTPLSLRWWGAASGNVPKA